MIFLGRLIIEGNRVYELDEECMRMKNRNSGKENHQKKETCGSLKQKPRLNQRTDRNESK